MSSPKHLDVRLELGESHRPYELFVIHVRLLAVSSLLLPSDGNWLRYTHVGLPFDEGDRTQPSGVAVRKPIE